MNKDLKDFAREIRSFESVWRDNLSPVERGIIKLAVRIVQDMAETWREFRLREGMKHEK